MAITPIPTREHLVAVWSTFGVVAREDDDDDLDAEDADEENNVLYALEKGTVDVLFYLLQRYTLAQCRASTWVTWACAIFACIDLARRRGNPVAGPLLEEKQRYEELLKLIMAGTAALPTDEGIAAPQYDNTPFVSNLFVDSRFPYAPIRRNPITSTPTTGSRTRPQLNGYVYPGWGGFLYW